MIIDLYDLALELNEMYPNKEFYVHNDGIWERGSSYIVVKKEGSKYKVANSLRDIIKMSSKYDVNSVMGLTFEEVLEYLCVDQYRKLGGMI